MCGQSASKCIYVGICVYLSMLFSESILHTVGPLLQALLQRIPSKASTLVPPSTSKRRRPLIHRVVSCLARGNFTGAVTSCIGSVYICIETSISTDNDALTMIIIYTYMHVKSLYMCASTIIIHVCMYDQYTCVYV